VLIDRYCPFINECKYANPLCYGMRVFDCPLYEEYERKLREELETILKLLKKSPIREHIKG